MSNKRVSCFIRKNTPELRAKLEAIGIKTLPIFINFPCLQFNSNLNCVIPADYHNRDGAIDCGENEDLFLALCAVGVQNDKGKWFCIVRVNGATDEIETIWRKCNETKFDLNSIPYASCIHFYEATPEEILEYFKNR